MPRIGRGALPWRQRGTAAVCRSHPPPTPAREDDGNYFAAHSLGTTRESAAALAAKITAETIEAVV